MGKCIPTSEPPLIKLTHIAYHTQKRHFRHWCKSLETRKNLSHLLFLSSLVPLKPRFTLFGRTIPRDTFPPLLKFSAPRNFREMHQRSERPSRFDTLSFIIYFFSHLFPFSSSFFPGNNTKGCLVFRGLAEDKSI